VAADILSYDGAQESALETQSRALANADHLVVISEFTAGIFRGSQLGSLAEVWLALRPATLGG